MRLVILTLSLLFSVASTAQIITPNPKVQGKSVKDVYVNKIEITDDYTILSLQYISKTADETLREFLQANPAYREELRRMSPMMRSFMLNRLLGSGTQSTISIQPSSYLKAKDGSRYKFIKATNIPVAPDRKVTKPGEKYFFKAYFERLEPGVTVIDFIENEQEQQDGFEFWNLYGVEVNNPAILEPEQVPATDISDIMISGKIYDALTNQTISASISCKLLSSGELLDEMNTSKAGAYAFEVPAARVYLFEIKAEGYNDLAEEIDLTRFTGKTALEKSIFLEPIVREVDSLETPAMPEIEVNEETPLITLDSVGMQVDEAKIITLKNMYFAKGRAQIMRASYDELDKLVNFLDKNPEINIRVDGHTDNQGDAEKNKVLSINRAKNVRDYLIKKGIATERISFKGWGDTKPIASNDSDIERQKNRRVEIVILD